MPATRQPLSGSGKAGAIGAVVNSQRVVRGDSVLATLFHLVPDYQEGSARAANSGKPSK